MIVVSDDVSGRITIKFHFLVLSLTLSRGLRMAVLCWHSGVLVWTAMWPSTQ